MNKGQFAGLLYQTFTKWQRHDATLRAAALTFFIMVPLPSLILIAVEVLAQVYGQQAALEQFIIQVSSVAGPAVADLLRQLLADAQSPLTGFFGSFIAVVFAFAGALGAFSVFQKSIDVVWEIKAQKRGRKEFIKQKLLPFTLVFGVGVIVVVWTAFSTVLFNAIVFALEPIFGGFTSFIIWVVRVFSSFLLGALLFAILFKELPDTEVEWRDVWLAAVLTAVIFTVLNYVFGFYLSIVQVTTLAGTAGALIVLFLWIYLVNLFILFGAQFSKVYAQAYGSYKNKPPVLKSALRPKVDHVEVKAEIDIKAKPQKSVE